MNWLLPSVYDEGVGAPLHHDEGLSDALFTWEYLSLHSCNSDARGRAKTPFVLYGFFLSSNDAICCYYIYLGLRLSTIHPATLPASTISSATVMAGEGSSMPSHDEETVASAFGAASGGRRRNPSSDRQAKWLHEWDRVFLLMCAAGLVVDPLFFYALSISSTCMCLFVDGWFAVTVTALRCMTDAVHLLNMPAAGDGLRRNAEIERGREGCVRGQSHGARPELLESEDRLSPRSVHHPPGASGCSVGRSSRNAVPRNDVDGDDRVLDLVSLAVPPEGLSLGLLPSKAAEFFRLHLRQHLGRNRSQPDSLLRCIACEYAKLTCSISIEWFEWTILLPRSQPSNNSSELDSCSTHHSLHCRQAAGACWYLLGIQRATECLKQQCVATDGCRNRTVACVDPMYYGTARAAMDGERLAWAKNLHVRSMCVDSSDNFEYGSYKWIVNLVTNPNRLEKVLFPIFWGLMTLSTFGTIESTTEWVEITFNIIIVTSALLLVTTLIGTSR
ncbi:cyclic nucleotide-gated ion channel [Musa troglodytarum]|uniref:Cyclic nucleotide-gated ion channel n=1 Tax=Musa troglodytarum TaxID=320322 RepID=A0A9E7L2B5_9LILI|nr:cyclic nucleotide-gated ion channel [Musa troglodytarum]